jgi:hypothetical protein
MKLMATPLERVFMGDGQDEATDPRTLRAEMKLAATVAADFQPGQPP